MSSWDKTAAMAGVCLLAFGAAADASGPPSGLITPAAQNGMLSQAQANQETPEQTLDRLLSISDKKWTAADTSNLKTKDDFQALRDSISRREDAIESKMDNHPTHTERAQLHQEFDQLHQVSEKVRALELEKFPPAGAAPAKPQKLNI